jgi:ribose-phosphate pyrophosphokinase
MGSNVVVGQSDIQLCHDIASTCKIPYIPLTISQFADSETIVTIENDGFIVDAHVLLVHQFSRVGSNGTVHINDQLIGLLEAIDLLRLMKARSIKVFLPYLSYSRQDFSTTKQFEGAIFMLGRCLKALGVTELWACDLHSPEICSSFPLPLRNITLDFLWAQMIQNEIISSAAIDSFCIVSPDHGGKQRAEHVASLLGVSFAYAHKVRVGADTAVGCELVGNVNGKKIIILDDIIDTARTAISACDLAFAQGAIDAYGCFTHAVFSVGSEQRFKQSSFKKIIITNTVLGVLPDGVTHQISVNTFLVRQIIELINQTSI